MLTEQQFKLGATFALIGEYEFAYKWLEELQKQGYEGDGPFYYWLTYSAYFTGHENNCPKHYGKRLLKSTLKKKGLNHGVTNIRLQMGLKIIPIHFEKLESDI